MSQHKKKGVWLPRYHTKKSQRLYLVILLLLFSCSLSLQSFLHHRNNSGFPSFQHFFFVISSLVFRPRSRWTRADQRKQETTKSDAYVLELVEMQERSDNNGGCTSGLRRTNRTKKKPITTTAKKKKVELSITQNACGLFNTAALVNRSERAQESVG
jgi:hypothetical protein